MFRIDDPTAAAILPAPAAAGVPGYFSDGNPATGTPPTTVPADWFNMIQEELIGLLVKVAIAPDKTSRGQVLAAILKLIVGDAGNIGPNGYIALAGGLLVLQWGTVAIPAQAGGALGGVASGSSNFPTPFPSACFGIVGSAKGPPNATWHPIVMTFPSTTTVAFNFVADTTASGTQNFTQASSFFWIALGN